MRQPMISYRLPESVWAWLLWTAGAKSTQALPLKEPPDLSRGAEWLEDNDFLMRVNGETAVEPALMRLARELSCGLWQLDMWAEGFTANLLGARSCLLLTERAKGGYLITTPLQNADEAEEYVYERSPEPLYVRVHGETGEPRAMGRDELRMVISKLADNAALEHTNRTKGDL